MHYPSHLSRRNFARPEVKPIRMRNGGAPVTLSIDDIGYNNTSFLYDSFSVAQNAAFPALTPMFTVAQSGSKTPCQTNMDASGMLANNEMFDLSRVCFIPSANTYIADAVNIAQLVRVSLQVKGREFIYGPSFAFPGARGGVLTAVSNLGALMAATNINSGYTNGVSEIHNAFAFETPIRIQNNDGFKVNVVADTAFSMVATALGGLGTTIYVFLDGKRLRKVA
jgi:hypothetical protein